MHTPAYMYCLRSGYLAHLCLQSAINSKSHQMKSRNLLHKAFDEATWGLLLKACDTKAHLMHEWETTTVIWSSCQAQCWTMHSFERGLLLRQLLKMQRGEKPQLCMTMRTAIHRRNLYFKVFYITSHLTQLLIMGPEKMQKNNCLWSLNW